MLRVGSVVTGSSSSLMVPVAVPVVMVAPLGSLRVTVKVSFSSSSVSSVVGTEIGWTVVPGANVSVPDMDV